MVIPRLVRLDDGLTQLIFLDVNSEIDSIQNEMMNFNSFFFNKFESITLSYNSPCIMFSLHNSIFKKMSKPQIGLKKILRLKTHESEIMLCTRVCYACSPITLKWWWACNDLGFCRGIFSIMNKLWVGMRPPPYRQGEVEGPSQKEYFYNGETRWGHYDSETVWGRPNWFLQRQKRWKRLLSSHFLTMAEPFI